MTVCWGKLCFPAKTVIKLISADRCYISFYALFAFMQSRSCIEDPNRTIYCTVVHCINATLLKFSWKFTVHNVCAKSINRCWFNLVILHFLMFVTCDKAKLGLIVCFPLSMRHLFDLSRLICDLFCFFST